MMVTHLALIFARIIVLPDRLMIFHAQNAKLVIIYKAAYAILTFLIVLPK